MFHKSSKFLEKLSNNRCFKEDLATCIYLVTLKVCAKWYFEGGRKILNQFLVCETGNNSVAKYI